MEDRFPSAAFFERLRRRLAEEEARFRALGTFDATFGLRVLPGQDAGGAPSRLFVVAFDGHRCTQLRQIDPTEGTTMDFVLAAPEPAWRAMLASLGPDGGVAPDQTINTLTHYDDPMQLESADPAGQDKLFRYAASVQLVFDLAAAVELDR